MIIWSAANKHGLLDTPANYESVVVGYQPCSPAHLNRFCICTGSHLLRTRISSSSLHRDLSHTFFLIILWVKVAMSYSNNLLLIPQLSHHLADINIPTRSSSTQSTNSVNPFDFLHLHCWLVALLSTALQSSSHTYKLLITTNLFCSLHCWAVSPLTSTFQCVLNINRLATTSNGHCSLLRYVFTAVSLVHFLRCHSHDFYFISNRYHNFLVI